MSSNVRVMIFFDGSNLFWGKREYNKQHSANLKIDYEKLVNFLVADRSLVRAIYYCSVPVPLTDERQIKFMDYIRKCGIQIVEKELKVRTNPATGESRYIEKGVDVALATDILGMAWEDAYDVAILGSGDGDYIGAVNRVMNKGKNVELACFRGTCSTELRKSTLKTTFIDNIVELIKMEE